MIRVKSNPPPPCSAPQKRELYKGCTGKHIHNTTYRLHRETLEVFLAKWPFGSEIYRNLSSGISSVAKSRSTKNNITTLLNKQQMGFKILPQKYITTIRYSIYSNT
jgi:hypothetical protein